MSVNKLNIEEINIDGLLDEIETDEKDKSREISTLQLMNLKDVTYKPTEDPLFVWIQNIWKVGSCCEVYSNSDKKWLQGNIKRIFTNSEGEWFEVQYINEEKILTYKQTQRFNINAIRPLTNALPIYKYIYDATRKKQKCIETDNQLKTQAKIISGLAIGDNVDINAASNGHFGWRCGEITDEKSGAIQVIYEIDDDDQYYYLWIDTNSEQQIAECGAKVPPLDMLKRHYYEQFFNLKKNADDIELIKKRVSECFEYITIKYNQIVAQTSTNIITKSVEYLNTMRYRLYSVIICCEIKNLLMDEDFNKIKKEFDEIYSQMVQRLGLINDKFHLDVTKEVYTVDNQQSAIHNDNVQKMAGIKIEWYHLIMTNPVDDDMCFGDKNIYKCPCIQRIKFLFAHFEQYFIQCRKKTVNQEKTKKSKTEFITVFNRCINDQNQYSVVDLINDCNHIQYYHIHDIFHKSYSPIPVCTDKLCILNEQQVQFNESGSYFGYISHQEINIIHTMVKYHIYFKHRNILNPTTNLPRIYNNQRKTTKFMTEVIQKNKKQIDDNNLNKDQYIMPKLQFGEKFVYSKYCQHENYIKAPKYRNLKNELLENNIHKLTVSLFYSYLKKAINHSLIRQAKVCKACNNGEDNYIYEVPANSPISICHLLCICIYTDDDELQRKFKKLGCRQNETDMSLDDRKKLNMEIGSWYWLFCQTVYLYGDNTKPSDVLYHGLSVKLLFASFTPLFECPISTTIDIAVAQGFADGEGIVLELRPLDYSHDKYLRVEWISAHPGEQEYLFASAAYLSIHDVRFTDFECSMIDSYHTYVTAMRLFDYIVNKHCSYIHQDKLLQSEQLLLDQLKFETFSDQIYAFNVENNLQKLNKILLDFEYDSDSIDADIQNSNVDSNILTYISKIDDEKKAMLFKTNYDNCPKIPQYLRLLFKFMIKESQKCVQENEKSKIHIIKSEYNQLNIKLQRELEKLYSNDDIASIKEFEWTIEGGELNQFKSLKNGKRLNGEILKWVINNENDEFVAFTPIIYRSDPSFPSHCSIGIEINHVPNTISTEWFCWSVAVKEIEYSSDLEFPIEATKTAYECVKTFRNDDNKFENLSKLTIKIYIREY
eukprot:440026_1